MNGSAKTTLEATTAAIVIFLLLMVAAYFAFNFLVYKTPVFSTLNRNAKEAVVKIASVVVFCLLGYYFSGATI